LPDGQPYNDRELLLRIADGDEMAFRELFDKYTPRMRPVIRAIVGAETVVKDLIQDVFLLLWISREKLPDVQSPEKWIFRIVHYECYRWLRQQSVRNRAQLQLTNSAVTAHPLSNSTEEYSRFQETAQLIRQAIHSLPPQAKKVYQLRREADMKIDEIAHDLNLSPKTVKNTLTRALQAIQAYLEERGIVIPVFLLAYFLQ